MCPLRLPPGPLAFGQQLNDLFKLLARQMGDFFGYPSIEGAGLKFSDKLLGKGEGTIHAERWGKITSD
jgi:hypothetical protein